MVQAVPAVRLTRPYTEEHASSAGKADVGKDEVAEEMAAAPRTGTTARRKVTTARVALNRTRTHRETAAMETRKENAGAIAATKPPVEVEDGARLLAKATVDVASTATTLPRAWVAQLPPLPLA